ncbi:MAG: hypothetical protein JSS02_12085 [Planctomycetes bacterium]|nr:hypothetical protein [Planctomycetota bacterium]
MSVIPTPDRLQLPQGLETQLQNFRRRVWSIKMIEAACVAVFGLVVPCLLMFVADRFWDSPIWMRLALFATTVAGLVVVPYALHRWVWRNRRLEQLARLLSHKLPYLGDQLLGVIELVHNDSEQARSRALCEAAIRQVADDAQKQNFQDAVPAPRHKLFTVLAICPTAAMVVLGLFFPAATGNAWARLLLPWQNVPRYTFAAFQPMSDQLVVPHGEPFQFTATLTETSLSHPARGTVQLGDQPALVATLNNGQYQFELPAQISGGQLAVAIGDFRQTITVDPKLRPELNSVTAVVHLPEYLKQPDSQTRDVRGGVLALVEGSRVKLQATASRELNSATVDGTSVAPQGAQVTSPEFSVKGDRKVAFQWTDAFGLAAREPFVVSLSGREDEAPSLTVEDLPRQKVLLDTETLAFKVRARDDFGIKAVGLEWNGVESPIMRSPAVGERLLSAGGPDKDSLEVNGTFSGKSLGIEPQQVLVRVYAEDYLPGRERVYSAPHTFYILTPEQHAIWITEKMSQWHRQALEVRDRELQLHETNKQIREMSQSELDQPETRRKIEAQANAERANGRRLAGLSAMGDDLVKQAMRNPEIGVGHLEKWAEMLQVLKDISGNRMPNVADLLKQASQAPVVAQNDPKTNRPTVGNVRAQGQGKGADPKDEQAQKPKQPVPGVTDVESSQQPMAKNQAQNPPSQAKSKQPQLRLPVTTIMGNGGGKPQQPPPPADEQVDEAVQQQADLLAEFDKIADELNRVLANLEGSTLVKRLKAASRVQYKIGGRIGDQLKDTFGVTASLVEAGPKKVLDELSHEENKASQDVSFIMDDMQSFFERRHFAKFKSVLEEMRQEDVIGSLRQLGDDLKKENGMSLAQCDYWSDTLDRWSEDLVDPACKGCCPGCKSKGSLPPSIVLEVLQILEGEINLREETRVTEQARPAHPEADYKELALKLSGTQAELQDRVDKVIERILELPDAQEDFGKELKLLGAVSQVMKEGTAILARPDTGRPAIAAETEAIELLLQSKRINPKSGGGGGSNPGGGGGGTTQDSALALVGSGVNDKELREDRGTSQATGDAGPVLPEEFRAGLDEYFNRLDRGSSRD